MTKRMNGVTSEVPEVDDEVKNKNNSDTFFLFVYYVLSEFLQSFLW